MVAFCILIWYIFKGLKIVDLSAQYVERIDCMSLDKSLKPTVLSAGHKQLYDYKISNNNSLNINLLIVLIANNSAYVNNNFKTICLIIFLVEGFYLSDIHCLWLFQCLCFPFIPVTGL